MLRFEVEPLRGAVSRALADPNEGVRFAALMTAARARLCGISPEAASMSGDPSPSVRAAAICLLALCSEDVDQSPLASMVLSNDRTNRANAALVLATIGNASAAPILREAMKRPIPVEDEEVIRATELALAESLVQLGDRRQLETIRAAFFAPASQSGLTALASQMAGRLQDRTLIPAVAALAMSTGPRKAGPELRLIAAEALARMEPNPALAELAVALAAGQPPTVRMQAAAVLMWDQSRQGLAALAAMLDDPNPRVRTAAAGAILSRANSATRR